MILIVLSVDPPSIIINSIASEICGKILCIELSIVFSQLYDAEMIEIIGLILNVLIIN